MYTLITIKSFDSWKIYKKVNKLFGLWPRRGVQNAAGRAKGTGLFFIFLFFTSRLGVAGIILFFAVWNSVSLPRCRRGKKRRRVHNGRDHLRRGFA